MRARFEQAALFFVVVGLLGTCTPGTRSQQAERAATTEVVRFKELRPDDPNGLRLTLREGEAPRAAFDRPPLAQPQPLSDAETEKVLARLQPMKVAEQKEFAFRARSLPAPRTGKTITTTLPPPPETAEPPESDKGPLRITRFAPEGNVPIAPQMSVTFSQPMVPVTSHATLTAKDVPVTIEPAVGGAWRWLGSKTLYYEADEHLPMATTYQVSVPAGTRSATGGQLAATKTWFFSTPPPTITQRHPEYGPHGLEPIIWMSFDQRIDKQQMLQSISVSSGQQTRHPVRLATAEEIEADKALASLIEDVEHDDRWLALKPSAPLPRASTITVTVNEGAGSLEGPRKTTKEQSWTFETYTRLTIVRHRCAWSRDECRPHWPLNIEFNNPLDAEAFDEKLIRIEPPVDNLHASVSWDQLTVTGRTKARTTYTVIISPQLKDQFGQALGEHKRLEFQVGPAWPQLSAAREGFVILDPAAQGRYSVFSVNFKRLKVELFAVQPRDWPAFAKAMQKANWRGRHVKMPGKRVLSKTMTVKKSPDEMVETLIDLSPALDNGRGQVIVTVEHLDPLPHKERRVIRSWVQVTDMALSAFVDSTELVGWASSLRDGEPISGAKLSLLQQGASTQTNAKGLGALALARPAKPKREVLIARTDEDLAILPAAVDWWSSGGLWVKQDLADSLSWYVFDDRGMYKPKETVHIKGWVRKVGAGEGGDVGAIDELFGALTYVVRDSRGNKLGQGRVEVSTSGSFHFDFDIPDNANLGPASLELKALKTTIPGRVHYHAFPIQEFRRPEFEVSVTASEGPHMIGSRADLTAEARYFAGGGLGDAPVQWFVTWKPGSFVPPNRDDFSFGHWTPWWIYSHDYEETKNDSLSGKTDATGKHHLRIDFEAVKPARPMSLTAHASVIDVNRQTWSASKTILVHPADEYVGLRLDQPYVDRTSPIKVDAIVTDLDGEAVSGRDVMIQAFHLRWVHESGQWQEKEENPQTCNVTSVPEPVTCRFETPDGGSYTIRATIHDTHGRPNQSDRTVWVTGGKLPPSRNVEQEKITLVPNAKTYQPGDTAELLVLAPFSPAEGVLSIRRSGIVQTRRFSMTEPSTTLQVEISEAHIPNVTLQVDLVGAAPRVDATGKLRPKLPKRPAYASGSIELEVPPLLRTLKLDATPRDPELEPGGETVIDVTLKDASGKPVEGGEVAVVVVDEAILALTGYAIVDPLTVFYYERQPGGRDHHGRASVLLANPEELREVAAAGPAMERKRHAPMELAAPIRSMAYATDKLEKRKGRGIRGGVMLEALGYVEGDEDNGGDEAAPIRMRLDFDPLALFAPEVATDARGKATVKVTLPDNLTRYRVMAVAAARDKEFGAGESSITARMPLMVRPSPPRFLNFGDRMELPIVLQNQLEEPIEAHVAVRAANAILTGGAGRRVTIPANDRVEVRFPAAAAMPGTARFQIGATAGRWSDAAEVELPVWTPATSEAFATYGEVDDGAIKQPVEGPRDVVPQFGGLEVTTSSTQLQALTDAVLYLASYPFECAEQISSRVLAIAALRDVLAAFEAEGLPPPKELVAALERDLQKLQGMQNPDGGFGFWRRDNGSWPWITIHVAHALVRAKAKGFAIPDFMLPNALAYLRGIEDHVAIWPWPYARREAIAYATYVLHLAGTKHPGKARRIMDEAGLEGLSLGSAGMILPVLAGDPASATRVAMIRRYLHNRVTETAAAAHFVTSQRDGDYLTLRSSRRADAIILESLIRTQPTSDLIAKLVRGLLGHRKRGRWGNTQENVFVLLALDRYFARYERQTPDFVARAWLGERFAGAHTFKGRTTERFHIDIPMRHVLEGSGKHDLVVGKEGAGRLYYRIGMRYVPKSLVLDPVDHGFTVLREYEAVDDPAEVTRGEDGTWRIKAGARVRVRLKMVAPSRRYHVALIDPLPAGLEPLNPALKTSGPIPTETKEADRWGRWWWWRRPWFEHQNMRDERIEAFASLLWDGVHNYTYVARATTPGSFVVPPPKAEEMYHPETFGRGATDRVVVE